jgi:hypothetical protein
MIVSFTWPGDVEVAVGEITEIAAVEPLTVDQPRSLPSIAKVTARRRR